MSHHRSCSIRRGSDRCLFGVPEEHPIDLNITAASAAGDNEEGEPFALSFLLESTCPTFCPF